LEFCFLFWEDVEKNKPLEKTSNKSNSSTKKVQEMNPCGFEGRISGEKLRWYFWSRL